MKESNFASDRIESIVGEITQTYADDTGIDYIDTSNLPVRRKIKEVLNLLIETLFPGYTGKRTVTKSNVNFIVIDILYHVYTELSEQIERAYRYQCRLQNCDTGDC